MVREAISITTTTVSASGRPPTYGEIALIGTGAGGSQPDAENKLCLDISEVETYFGIASDIAVAAAIIFGRGVRQIRCTRAATVGDADLEAAIDEMKDEDIDFLIYANTLLESGNATEFDAIIGRCDTNKWLHMIGASGIVADIQTDFGAITNSQNVVGIAAKTNNDIAAAIAAEYSLKKPWEKMMWMGVSGVSISDYYSPSDVDSLESGSPPVNVAILKRETDVVSDGLTTEGGDYKYIDITRTRYWLEELIKDRLEALLMMAEVPFDESGLSQVESKIAEACDSLLEDGGITSYVIDVPLLSSISAVDKAARVLNNVKVTATLAGHIQTINILLKLVIQGGEKKKMTQFDIKQVDCLVDGEPVVELGPDGFGITPGAEHTNIEGLMGELGFNIDPSTAAEGSVSLKSISSSFKALHTLWINKTEFVFSIKAKKGKEALVGFKEIKMEHAIFAKAPEWKTNGKEAPDVTFGVAGYGFNIEPLD